MKRTTLLVFVAVPSIAYALDYTSTPVERDPDLLDVAYECDEDEIYFGSCMEYDELEDLLDVRAGI